MGAQTGDGKTRKEITEQIFTNAPTMLALCLTTAGIIKVYTAVQQVTTLADNFLAISLMAFLFATIASYFALRSRIPKRAALFAKIADICFLSGLSVAAFIALFMIFTLAG